MYHKTSGIIHWVTRHLGNRWLDNIIMNDNRGGKQNTQDVVMSFSATPNATFIVTF